MSLASDFKTAAKSAESYEVMGESGASYIFFFFPDHSVCAAKKVAPKKRATAQLIFQTKTKSALRDCGVVVRGSTYQKGEELLKQLGR
jgi:hypothetical protein